MGAPVLKIKKAVGLDSVRPRLLRLILCLLVGLAHFGQTDIIKIIPKIKVSARNSVNQSEFTFHLKFLSL
jgi:hypothetical protein